MTNRWLLGLLIGLAACVRGPARVHGDAASDVASAVLATAAESVFVRARSPASSGALLASDSTTARALSVPARRSGMGMRVAQEPVWCDGGPGADRTTGTKVTISLGSITADRAVAHWSVICLLESATHSTPFGGGSGGSLELARRGRAWQVVGVPTTFSY